MIDLTTTYMGLTLKNPLVPSASPLSKSLDTMKRLEDHGAQCFQSRHGCAGGHVGAVDGFPDGHAVDGDGDVYALRNAG